MMKRAIVLFLALLVALGIGYFLGGRHRAPEAPPPMAASQAPAPATPAEVPAPAPASRAAVPPAPGPAAPAAAPAAPAPEAPALAATADAADLPAGYPRTEVPHRVEKAWGRGPDGRAPAAVGLSIVVDPSITNAELEDLSRDVLTANEDARMMHVRIYDSAEAMSPAAHAAHDPAIAEHTVGEIWVNPKPSRFMPKRRIKIRGENIDPERLGFDSGTAEQPGP